MKSKALVVTEPGTLEQREIDVPEPGPGEVLVRIELSGICGSDVHMFNGGMELDFPVLPGHELAGVVEALGEGTTTDSKGESVSEGDAVTVVPGGNTDYARDRGWLGAEFGRTGVAVGVAAAVAVVAVAAVSPFFLSTASRL